MTGNKKIFLKFVSILVLLFITIFSFSKNNVAVFALGGEGTSDNPYQISTLDDFNTFRNIVNGTGETKNTAACAILTADINLNNTSSDKTIQLGSQSDPYSGTFNGNGYTISNVYIDTETQDTVGGLFKYTTAAAVVKNFSITGTVKCKKPSAVVGVNRGTIENVTNRANITVNKCNTQSWTDYRAGGIAAENAGGIIRYCNNYGTIYSYNYGGGIVGKAYFSETSTYGYIEHCVNYGLVSIEPEEYTWSGYYIGGIAGISVGNYIRECIHAGEVYGELYIAGILGQMGDIDNDNHPHIIDRCLSIGTVKGKYPSRTFSDGIGAILGKVERGNIIDNDPDDLKFLYRNYYLEGSVSYDSGTAVIKNCGYGETFSTNIGTGHRDVNGQAQGLTAAKIKVKNNFNNWTFGDFYEMGKDNPVTSDEAINQAIELIDNIGTVEYTDACKDKIDLAERVYDGLSQVHKAKVTNSSVLAAALVTYAELKANHDAADAAIALINAIGIVEYTDQSKEKIDEARAAYDNLTEEQKDIVDSEAYAVLTDAEATYAKLKIDHEAADPVIALINSIGTVQYIDMSKKRIDAARAAYDNLTEEQKDIVDSEIYTVLTNAEATYAKLKKDHDAANAVIALINSIGTVEYIDASKEKIDAARTAYDALSDDQKAQVTNYDILTKAVESYAELEKAAHTSKGLPVGAVIAIILVAIIALLGVAYFLLFFVFNRWIKNGEKAIRVVRLGKKGEQVRLLAMSFKVIYRDEAEIFKTKEEALK